MKPHELAIWLGVSTASIRAWTSDEYKQYFSPTAQGGDGRYRYFTDTDMRILAYIVARRKENAPREEIHMHLSEMQAADWNDLPLMPAAPPGAGPISMIPREAAETAVSSQRSALLREISMLQDRIATLEEELAKTREGREELISELAAANRELELWRAGRLKPTDE